MLPIHKNCYTVKCGDLTPRAAWSLKHAQGIARDLVSWVGGVARVLDFDNNVVGTASVAGGRVRYRKV